MGKKLFKIFIGELILISLIFAGLYLYRNTDVFGVKEIIKSEERVYTSDNTKSVNIDEDISSLEQKIQASLLAGESVVNIANQSLFKSAEEIFKIIDKVTNNNAEIMYYSSVEYSGGKLKFDYTKSKEELNNHQKELRDKKQSIINQIIEPTMTDYEKTIAIHNYIISNSRYDRRLIDEGKVPPESYTAYGNLVLGIGVCEGYAKAFKYILDDVGVETLVIVGTSKDQNHAWNIVKLDGEYYHIDTTWNDPIPSDNVDVLQYNYFNLTDEVISKTHTWDKSKYPEAKGTYYNYFSYNNLIVNTNDELEQRVKTKLLDRSNSLNIKFNNNEIIEIDKIIEKIAYANPRINLASYSYSIDIDQGIYQLKFYYY